MNIKISRNTFQGKAKAIGRLNGTDVPDETDKQIKEELAKADQSTELRSILKRVTSKKDIYTDHIFVGGRKMALLEVTNLFHAFAE